MEFHPYQKNFPELFQKEKTRIKKAIGEYDVEHIGSTAIPGMSGKGIIDIALSINNWQESEDVISKLKKIGYSHIHPKEDERIFLATNKESKLGDCHIHIVLKDSKAYKSLVAFRNYFLSHPEEVPKYSELKKKLWQESGKDRKKYGKLKSKLIKELN